MKKKQNGFLLFVVAFLLALAACDPIVEGETYGSYVVDDVVVKGGLSGGIYSFYAENGNDGFVEMYRDGDYVETLYYNWQTTVSPTLMYTFDFSVAKIRIKKAGTGTINLYNMPSSIFNNEYFLDPAEIEEDVTYGSYIVDSVTSSGAGVGEYTFYAENGNDGFVKLYKDGDYVETLNYIWQTTVTPTTMYTFNFTNISLTVKKAGTGSINLYNMPQSVFDGYHCFTVE